MPAGSFHRQLLVQVPPRMGIAVGATGPASCQLSRHPYGTSSRRRGDSWTPTGRPSSSTCTGREMAGCPVVLKAGVKRPLPGAGQRWRTGVRFCAISPSRGDGPASVGRQQEVHAAVEASSPRLLHPAPVPAHGRQACRCSRRASSRLPLGQRPRRTVRRPGPQLRPNHCRPPAPRRVSPPTR